MKKENSSYYYALDDMLSIFKDHAKARDKLLKENKEKYPEGVFPDDEFNLFKALYSMCHEIDLLKKGR